MDNLVYIFFSALLINNFTLSYFLGLCPFFGVTEQVRDRIPSRTRQHIRDADYIYQRVVSQHLRPRPRSLFENDLVHRRHREYGSVR